MRPDPNYPRWMFHRSKPMVCVQNEEEERALGREWFRTPVPPIAAALPKEEKPEKMPDVEEPIEEEPEPKPSPAPEPEPPILKPPYKEKPAHHTAPAAKRQPAGAVRPPVKKK